MSAEPEVIVKEFCAAWGRRDVEEILAFFTDDAIYHNIPLEAVEGHEAIRNVLLMFVPPSESIEFEILRMAASGDVVFTERVDHFLMGGTAIDLPVAGVFEIRDGLIAVWRDYFDMAMFTQQSGPG